MNKVTVDEYILNSGSWQPALNMLRELMLALEMEETVKWGTPVYCINGRNVVGMASFKSYTGLWFYHGVFLEDRHNRLLTASGDDTRGLRQWRFQSADEIEADLDLVIAYIREAIGNAKAGKEIKPQHNKPFALPPELKEAIAADADLKKSFDLLSYSKRRDFSRYIDQAKRPVTRQKRLEKCIPLIREGRGLMDQYNL
jgi:uncharacterized protein YdeI (YjbR/CyaY-like superfamily)